jgi:hypothetical protein
MPCHCGQACDKQCPDLDILCLEILGYGLEHDDDMIVRSRASMTPVMLAGAPGGTMSWQI